MAPKLRDAVMHEVGIMESAISAALKQARERGAGRVHRIVIRVGTLSGVEPDALRFAFDIAANGTPADGAILVIETVPARAWCAGCGLEFEAASGFIFACPRCSRLSGELRRGRELELSQVEMS